MMEGEVEEKEEEPEVEGGEGRVSKDGYETGKTWVCWWVTITVVTEDEEGKWIGEGEEVRDIRK